MVDMPRGNRSRAGTPKPPRGGSGISRPTEERDFVEPEWEVEPDPHGYIALGFAIAAITVSLVSLLLGGRRG